MHICKEGQSYIFGAGSFCCIYIFGLFKIREIYRPYYERKGAICSIFSFV